MLTGLKNAFRIKELRDKILFTIALLVLYRIGAHVPVPGVPFQGIVNLFEATGTASSGAMALLNLFSGGALSYVSVFSLGIMPYITSSIIMQLLQSVVPSLHELAREGEVGQTKITQYSRYLTLGLALLNSIGYLFLFESYGVSFTGADAPEWMFSVMVVVTLTAGAMLIMWMGELITQRGIGNGMSLIIFSNIMAGLPQAISESLSDGGVASILITVLILVVIAAVIPFIVFLERGQRRIPVQYAKRMMGRRMMGGQSTYLPIKVNTAGVIPIIFASAILYFPAQLAVFFPNVGWINTFANAVSSGWLNWILSLVLIVFFAYFYTSMVFNPDETAETLKKQGGFIPGVRPGRATANYIKNALNKITLPSAVFLAVIAIVPSIVFSFTDNSLIQSFGGTSVLIMVGVVLDTLDQMDGQLKMYDYDGFFK